MTYAPTGLGLELTFGGSVGPSNGSAYTRTSGTVSGGSGGQPALIIPAEMQSPDLPPCIPKRYIAAANEWCAEQQHVRGLGATPMPVEYMGAPCRAAALPVCAAGQEPALTPPDVTRVAQTSGATPEQERARAAAMAQAAERARAAVYATLRRQSVQRASDTAPAAVAPTVVEPTGDKPNYLLWGVVGAAGLAAVLLLLKGKK
jgi:hypothetical protein